MKIAITIWGNRVSPVFDSSNTLMIASVKNSKIMGRQFEEYDLAIPGQILSVLKGHQIDCLICGAITDIQSRKIEQTGIKLFSFISGNAEKVLTAFVTDRHLISKFFMPGTIKVDPTLKKRI